MDYLAMYDISDPKRLKQVERIVRGFGVRVQKSVFECFIDSINKERLIRDVRTVINMQEDSFRIYPLLNESRIKQQAIGKCSIIEFKQHFLI